MGIEKYITKGGLIAGYTWKARMFNGAVFDFWTHKNITRKEAREKLLEIAVVYESSEIDSIWKCKK